MSTSTPGRNKPLWNWNFPNEQQQNYLGRTGRSIDIQYTVLLSRGHHQHILLSVSAYCPPIRTLPYKGQGYSYLGHLITTDVLINVAIQCRRSSDLDEALCQDDIKLVMVRAKVFRRSKHRRPLLIQKQFSSTDCEPRYPFTKRNLPVRHIATLLQI